MSLCSLIKNTSNDYQYNIYILYNSADNPLDEKNVNSILTYRKANVDIIFLDVKEKYTIRFRQSEIKRFSRAMSYYIFADELIHKDKILYLDSDTIINDDISIIYNEDISNYLIGAVLSEGVPMHYIKTIMQNDLHFNAGTVLINLQKYREQNIQSKCLELFNGPKIYMFQQEDILNILAEGQVKYLNPRYNMQWTSLFSPKTIEGPYNDMQLEKEDWENPFVMHYSGGCKPWKKNYNKNIYGQYDKFWWQYAEQTNLYKEDCECFNILKS